ncbi:hypothetical protein ACJX0J_020224, partial [Zea mays]
LGRGETTNKIRDSPGLIMGPKSQQSFHELKYFWGLDIIGATLSEELLSKCASKACNGTC